ncbi:30S ribosomal protein S4 [bacterium BMS3Bbin06]|nr:30S ribosomal protein S4 [bacterium BMS3Abin08]GBE34410.1 30S ribosomal protein S4 [bacterium BMS3Bbin06]HDO34800.1 30S ribosomal protein S4 [Nitrospirota bacterium]
MARYRDSLCRLCRREGEKLFLKGDRCFTDKCAFERRKYAPGQHGTSRSKTSDYGLQLREKQKVKRMYGVLERQFRKYFAEAQKRKGVTGEMLLQFLELRLDNIAYRMGFASNKRQARQLVNHGHIRVNGRKVNIPSFRVRVGDVVEVKEASRAIPFVQESLSKIENRGLAVWLEIDPENFRGKVLSIPTREEIPLTVKESLIVELYSK